MTVDKGNAVSGDICGMQKVRRDVQDTRSLGVAIGESYDVTSKFRVNFYCAYRAVANHSAALDQDCQ